MQLLPLLLLPLAALTSAQSTSTTSATTTSGTQQPQQVTVVTGPNLPAGYAYHGCYNETTDLPDTTGVRALAGGANLVKPGGMTVETCLDFCKTGAGDASGGKSGRFKFAGLEYARCVLNFPFWSFSFLLVGGFVGLVWSGLGWGKVKEVWGMLMSMMTGAGVRGRDGFAWAVRRGSDEGRSGPERHGDRRVDMGFEERDARRRKIDVIHEDN